jgi:hypothetical protein
MRWRDEQGRAHSRVVGRKRDADALDAEVRRAKRMGNTALVQNGTETFGDLAGLWWRRHAVPNLERNTLNGYASNLDIHLIPRLGNCRLRSLTPQVVSDLRAELAAQGTGDQMIRKILIVLQAILERGVEWGRLQTPASAPCSSSAQSPTASSRRPRPAARAPSASSGRWPMTSQPGARPRPAPPRPTSSSPAPTARPGTTIERATGASAPSLRPPPPPSSPPRGPTTCARRRRECPGCVRLCPRPPAATAPPAENPCKSKEPRSRRGDSKPGPLHYECDREVRRDSGRLPSSLQISHFRRCDVARDSAAMWTFQWTSMDLHMDLHGRHSTMPATTSPMNVRHPSATGHASSKSMSALTPTASL